MMFKKYFLQNVILFVLFLMEQKTKKNNCISNYSCNHSLFVLAQKLSDQNYQKQTQIMSKVVINESNVCNK